MDNYQDTICDLVHDERYDLAIILLVLLRRDETYKIDEIMDLLNNQNDQDTDLEHIVNMLRRNQDGGTRCKAKQILRSAYTRKSGKTVKAACIRNVGRPGKGLRTGGPGIGTLKKGLLAKFGYSDITNKSDQVRHASLNKAVKAYGPLSVFRKLNAAYVYTKNTSPASSAIFLTDRDWIRKTYM